MSTDPIITKEVNPLSHRQELLYATAKDAMGEILAPENPTLGCAISVNALAKKAWGSEVGGGDSTYAMWQSLIHDKRFRKIDLSAAREGCIIISPTNSAKNAKLAHGHVGIVMRYGICSNTSANGLWSENYDIDSWESYFTTFGLLQTFVFEPVDN